MVLCPAAAGGAQDSSPRRRGRALRGRARTTWGLDSRGKGTYAWRRLGMRSSSASCAAPRRRSACTRGGCASCSLAAVATAAAATTPAAADSPAARLYHVTYIQFEHITTYAQNIANKIEQPINKTNNACAPALCTAHRRLHDAPASSQAHVPRQPPPAGQPAARLSLAFALQRWARG